MFSISRLISVICLVVGFFSLMIFNLFMFFPKSNVNNTQTQKYAPYSYNLVNQQNIFEFCEKIKGISEIFNFIKIFNEKLKKLDQKSSDTTNVNYYDIFSKNFYFYDFIEFNTILYETYVNDFLLKNILKDNLIYKDSKFFIDLILNQELFNFKIDQSFDVFSFFVKNLRFSELSNNVFSMKTFYSNVETNKSSFSTFNLNEFFGIFFEALNNNNIITSNGDIFYITEKYQTSLYCVLCRSFQPVILGYCADLTSYENKFFFDSEKLEELSQEYSKNSLKYKNDTDDFIFFSILISTTKVFSLNSYYNNIYYENILK